MRYKLDIVGSLMPLYELREDALILKRIPHRTGRTLSMLWL